MFFELYQSNDKISVLLHRDRYDGYTEFTINNILKDKISKQETNCYAQDYVNDKENTTAQVATEFKFPVFYGQNYDYSFTKKIQSNCRQRKFNERTLSILNNFLSRLLEHYSENLRAIWALLYDIVDFDKN
ncbi:hypothetical protein GJ496_003512 [Pomphorhynchus laevis]|nr:hypothetical protein GJ496_003512 [Pomphorhynchus laevis]